jgi:predicted MFS family arabinose efflux permease
MAGASFCFVTGESLPVALLPQLSRGLGVSLSAVGLLVTIYAVVVVAVSVPLTHLTRRVHRRALLCGLLGIFVAATLSAAIAPDYGWLVAARVVTALAQAIFWSIVAVVTVSLVPPHLRGTAVAAVFAGSSIALVVGLPLGTWLGQQSGWRISFVVLAVLGVLDLVALAVLLPPARPDEAQGSGGTNPDARRYRLIVVSTALCVAGFFTAYTYVTAFLTRVSGLPPAAIAPVLLLVGVADAVAVVATGVLLDRHPVLAKVGPAVLLAGSLVAFFALGSVGVAAALFQACAAFGLSGVAIALQSQVLVVAPRRTDIASAWFSTSFNVGIGGGPLVGGLVLSTVGLRFTPLVGAGLAFLGLVAIAIEARSPRRSVAA